MDPKTHVDLGGNEGPDWLCQADVKQFGYSFIVSRGYDKRPIPPQVDCVDCIGIHSLMQNDGLPYVDARIYWSQSAAKVMAHTLDKPRAVDAFSDLSGGFDGERPLTPEQVLAAQEAEQERAFAGKCQEAIRKINKDLQKKYRRGEATTITLPKSVDARMADWLRVFYERAGWYVGTIPTTAGNWSLSFTVQASTGEPVPL